MVRTRFEQFVCAMLMATCALSFLPAGAQAGQAAERPEIPSLVLTQDWQMRWGDPPAAEAERRDWLADDNWTAIERSGGPIDRGERTTLWMRTRMPAWDGRNPTLYAHSVDLVFEVFLDEEMIYRFGDLHPDGTIDFIGWPWHLIPLPADFAGRSLMFRIQSSISDIGIVGDVVLASEAHHLREILRRDLDQTVLAFLIVFVGLLAFVFGVFWRERRSAFSIGLFSLLMGVWTFSETELKQLLMDMPLLWTYLGLTTVYAAPVALLYVVEQTYGVGFRRILKIIRWALAAYACMAVGLSLTGVVLLPDTIRPFNVLVVVAIAVGLASLMRANVRSNPEAAIFTAGMSVLGAFVLVDVVLGWSNWRPPVTPWGLMLFVLSLSLILRYRFVAVHRRSVQDGLTGVANRYQFEALLELEWKRAKQDQRPLSLIMLDIDHFKAFNDTYGHPEGDVCLKQVADVLRAVTRRSGDVVARYGGEEFAVLLPGMEQVDAVAVAERMRVALESREIVHASSGVANRVTISGGVATLDPSAPVERGVLVERADEALYRAKHEGRNRTCGYAKQAA